MNDNGNANNIIPQNRRITIKHVARETGVSLQTVLRVINGQPAVAPETHKEILEFIDRLDFRPGGPVHSLIHRRSSTLRVIIADLKYIGPTVPSIGSPPKQRMDKFNPLPAYEAA